MENQPKPTVEELQKIADQIIVELKKLEAN